MHPGVAGSLLLGAVSAFHWRSRLDGQVFNQAAWKECNQPYPAGRLGVHVMPLQQSRQRSCRQSSCCWQRHLLCRWCPSKPPAGGDMCTGMEVL